MSMRLWLTGSSLAFGVVLCACSGGSAIGLDGGFSSDGGENLTDAGDASADAPLPPPLATKPLTVFGAYAVNQLFLGETDRRGVPQKDAWKSYGENLDGRVSTKIPRGECKL